jgi:hypothetical protein
MRRTVVSALIVDAVVALHARDATARYDVRLTRP